MILLILAVLFSLKLFALDGELADRLKQDLQHDAERKKGFAQYNSEKKKREQDKDKGLSLYLQEQEQWEMAREKTVYEYKKNKKKPMDEDSAEFRQDELAKQQRINKMEEARLGYIKDKKQIIAQYKTPQSWSEEDELGVYINRPRYDKRKRSQNKWTKSGKSLGGSSGGGFSGGYSGGDSGGGNFDLPPPPPPGDFNSFPQDNFDDFPPPPSNFDGNYPGTYDSGFGDGGVVPPPPPPPNFNDGFDF